MANDRKEDSHPHIFINGFETKGQVSASLSCHLFCEFRPIFPVSGKAISIDAVISLVHSLFSGLLPRHSSMQGFVLAAWDMNGWNPVLALEELAGFWMRLWFRKVSSGNLGLVEIHISLGVLLYSSSMSQEDSCIEKEVWVTESNRGGPSGSWAVFPCRLPWQRRCPHSSPATMLASSARVSCPVASRLEVYTLQGHL